MRSFLLWLCILAVIVLAAACGRPQATPVAPAVSTRPFTPAATAASAPAALASPKPTPTPSTTSLPVGPSPGPEPSPSPTPAEDPFRSQRERMVVEDIEARGVSDPLVLDAMRTVPRHLFVPEKYLARAYGDSPLPIGLGQTISQPYIVALMSEVLDVTPGERILEVGTGSGYQAAVLAEMGAKVYSIEIIPELAEGARQVLDGLGYSRVESRTGDGYFGWSEQAPFDGIIVTAAPDHVPPPLLEQLAPTGKMVIPVGPQGDVQTLWLIEQREGQWVSINLGRVRFVPLVGG